MKLSFDKRLWIIQVKKKGKKPNKYKVLAKNEHCIDTRGITRQIVWKINNLKQMYYNYTLDNAFSVDRNII